MASYHHQHQQQELYDSLDSLYCEEETCIDNEEEEEETSAITQQQKPSLSPLFLLEHDLFFDDDKELHSLFSKEQEQKQQGNYVVSNVDTDNAVLVARDEAVKWILKVNAYYGFTTLTAIFAINHLDRFLYSSFYQKDRPWMIQLVAVTCLSLASKVEETHVPLLLDLQVEETKYVFEAKTIQRMELLVLSSLKWKMHPVTPLSFLDHIIRRLGLKKDLNWDFYKRCEHLLLYVVSDSRSVSYLPSVLATAAMMHVIDQFEPFNSFDHHNKLLGVLNLTKEQVRDCYGLIEELSKAETTNGNKKSQKRKYKEIPRSPSGVIDASMFSSDSSNDSWGLESCVYSSPEPLFKKTKTQEKIYLYGSYY